MDEVVGERKKRERGEFVWGKSLGIASLGTSVSSKGKPADGCAGRRSHEGTIGQSNATTPPKVTKDATEARDPLCRPAENEQKTVEAAGESEKSIQMLASMIEMLLATDSAHSHMQGGFVFWCPSFNYLSTRSTHCTPATSLRGSTRAGSSV